MKIIERNYLKQLKTGKSSGSCNISSAIIIAVIVLSAFGLITGSKTDGSSVAMMCCYTTVLCSNCETTKKLKMQLVEMEKENVLA